MPSSWSLHSPPFSTLCLRGIWILRSTFSLASYPITNEARNIFAPRFDEIKNNSSKFVRFTDMQRDESYLFASSFAYIYNSIRFYSIFFTRLIQCNASRFGCASMYVCSRCLRISYRERLFRDGRTRREKRATLDSSDGEKLCSRNFSPERNRILENY